MSTAAESIDQLNGAPLEEAPAGRVLIVDDEEQVCRLLSRMLERKGYECEIATGGGQARERLAEHAFDLVLADVNMPDENGLDLVRDILSTHQETAVLMVSGADDSDIADAALALGAYGYIIKPFKHNEIVINVANALRRLQLEIENRQHQSQLEERVRERTMELWNATARLEEAEEDMRLSQEETIHRLSMAAEFKDLETGNHIERVSRYAALLATRLGSDAQRCQMVRLATKMHDIGKLSLPDEVLLEDGPLSSDQRQAMQRHTEIGYELLTGSGSELLEMAATIAYTHHERFDGTGYPRGLVGEQIPLEGRIAAIADVFDALTSDRAYRSQYHLDEAVGIMNEGRGSHFDPALLDLFVDSLGAVVAIRDQFLD